MRRGRGRSPRKSSGHQVLLSWTAIVANGVEPEVLAGEMSGRGCGVCALVRLACC
jgi:hypothetical protein